MGLLQAADGSNTTLIQFLQKAVCFCFYEHLGGRPPPQKKQNSSGTVEEMRFTVSAAARLVCLEYE